MTKAKAIIVATTILTSVAIASPPASYRPVGQFNLPFNQNSGLFRAGYIDSGLILGRITNFETRGYLFKSWEITFNFGDVGATDGFSSIPYAFSTLSSNVHNAIATAKKDIPFVLQYNRSIFHNPFRRETGYNIVATYPTYLENSVEEAGLKREFNEINPQGGGYGSGSHTGRIIKVQRWGRLTTSCTLTLHLKGTKTVTRYRPVTRTELETNYKWGEPPEQRLVTRHFKEEYSKTVMNVEKINLGSEEACRYAEQILPFAKTVEISANQSYFPEMMDYGLLASKIQVMDP